MALSLPSNPDLERFRRDARLLQRGVRDRVPAALDLVARHHPSNVAAGVGGADAGADFTLSDAQLVLARSYGFTSWPRLRDYLRRSEALSRDPAVLAAAIDRQATGGPAADTNATDDAHRADHAGRADLPANTTRPATGWTRPSPPRRLPAPPGRTLAAP